MRPSIRCHMWQIENRILSRTVFLITLPSSSIGFLTITACSRETGPADQNVIPMQSTSVIQLTSMLLFVASNCSSDKERHRTNGIYINKSGIS